MAYCWFESLFHHRNRIHSDSNFATICQEREALKKAKKAIEALKSKGHIIEAESINEAIADIEWFLKEFGWSH